jgi:hypothetical protein
MSRHHKNDGVARVILIFINFSELKIRERTCKFLDFSKSMGISQISGIFLQDESPGCKIRGEEKLDVRSNSAAKKVIFRNNLQNCRAS